MTPSVRRFCRTSFWAALLAAACLDGPTGPELPEPPAAIDVVSGDAQSAPAGEELPQPVRVRITDRNGAALVGARVQFRVRAGGGSVQAEYVTTNGTGIAAGLWTLGTVVGQIQQLEAIIPAESGGVLSATFTATVTPAAASQIVMVGGNNQVGMLGALLPESLAVRVADRYGNGVPGIAVTWSANGASGDTVNSGSSSSSTVGVAKAAWTLGARLDVPHFVTVSAAGLPTIMLSATAVVPPSAQLEAVAGDAQLGPVLTALAESLVVRLTLKNGAPVHGAPVQWAVSTGGGMVAPQATVTDATGMAKTEWVLGIAVVPNGVTATVTGLTPVTFRALAIADEPASLDKVAGDAQHGVPGQFALDSLVVRMSDRHGNPAPGAAVTFSVTSGDGTTDPASGTTDTEGRAATRFRLGITGARTPSPWKAAMVCPRRFSSREVPGQTGS
jgi:adhesin/invasin